MSRALGALLAMLLLAGSVSAYEEEPDLPRGEWLILEGQTEEALAWYRARHATNAAAWREGLAEALAARAADLLARRDPEAALPLLREAEGLSRDPERADRIRHLIAYARGRTTGHSIVRGHRALAMGSFEDAVSAYEQALRDARDAFERKQGRTLVSLTLLLEATLSPNGRDRADRAAELWPGEEGSTEDVQQFLWAARTNPALAGRLDGALQRLDGAPGEEARALRATALCMLLRTGEARRTLSRVERPGWREPLEALLAQAERLERRR